jgi:hypothetical protein
MAIILQEQIANMAMLWMARAAAAALCYVAQCMEDAPMGEIAVGAADGELRLWKAVEAVRLAELRLTAQAAARTAIEQRAATMAGWCNAALLALGAAMFGERSDVQIAAIMSSAAFLAASLAYCLMSLRPGPWGIVGYDWDEMQALAGESELEVRELVSVGYRDAIQMNEARLDRMARRVRASARSMAIAPAAGLAVISLGWAFLG